MVKDSRRTAKIVYNEKAYVLARPYTAIGGERAGPILSQAECGRRGDVSATLLSAADEGWSEECKQRIMKCAQQATGDCAKRALAKKRRHETQKLLLEKAEVMPGLDSTDCCSYKMSFCSNYRATSLKKRPSVCYKCAYLDGSKIRPFVSTPFTMKMSMMKLQDIVAVLNINEELCNDMLHTSGMTNTPSRERRVESAVNLF
jgi:hypothetical protein